MAASEEAAAGAQTTTAAAAAAAADAEEDAYGFPLQALTPEQAADRAACAAYAARRRAKWGVFADAQELPTGATLKRYCRKGIPPELRGWVWWHISGAREAAAAAAPGHFEAALAAGSSSAAVKQIELDLPRTFPRHPWLGGPEGQEALRGVLTAYAGHDPGVGYCQGMNFLVGLLLLAVEHDTLRCFWLLVVLLEQVLYPGTFAPNLDGCHVEMGVLAALLARKHPRLATHLDSLGCEASLLATDWYLCLFATSLPAESAARVWDALFSEGPKVLHRVALALLGGAAPAVMVCDNAGEVLRCVKTHAAAQHQRDTLMATAFKGIGGLPRARLDKLQAAEARRVAAMLAARSAKRSRADLAGSIAAGRALQQQQQEGGPAAQQQGGGGGGGSQNGQQREQQEQQLPGGAPAAAAAATAVSVRSNGVAKGLQRQQQQSEVA